MNNVKTVNKEVTTKEMKTVLNTVLDYTIKELNNLTNEQITTYTCYIDTLVNIKGTKDKQDLKDFKETLMDILATRIIDTKVDETLKTASNKKPPIKPTENKKETKKETKKEVKKEVVKEVKKEELKKDNKKAEDKKRAEELKKKVEGINDLFTNIKVGTKFLVTITDTNGDEYNPHNCKVVYKNTEYIIIEDINNPAIMHKLDKNILLKGYLKHTAKDELGALLHLKYEFIIVK